VLNARLLVVQPDVTHGLVAIVVEVDIVTPCARSPST
jgi:hypothetical protein